MPDGNDPREANPEFDAPTQPFVGDAAPLGEKLGSTVGPYKLLGVLGEGGFGTVYLADQEKPIRRRVALKIIKAGMDTRQVLARFEAERQALAMMDHPNIAKVFDAGSTDSGRSYFAMELVHGEPITDYCDRHKLTLEQRLELFIPVCQAVQHAHQKGIIHRDIKPKNVLVAVVDDRPAPKVIDFGVAKAMAQPLTQQTIYTEQGQLIGTPEYMSPEQAEMSNLDIDTRSDIYSLGVLLYELLTGALPFDHKTLRQAGFDEIRRIIREVEPPKPSTKISTLGEDSQNLAANRRIDLQSLRRRLRQELDWIVMKTLEKDRTRRYATATSLAEDVQHYLAHEPVQASPPGGWYRIRKYARHYRTSLAITASFAGILVAMMILAIRGYYQESRLHTDAEVSRQQAVSEAANARAAELQTDRALEESRQAQKKTEQVLVDMYTSAGLRADERHDPYEAVLWFAKAADSSRDDPDRLRANSLRFDSWSRRMWLPLRATRLSPDNPVDTVDFHPSGEFLLIHASPDKQILWDIVHNKLLGLPGGERPIVAAQWNPSGDRLALASANGQVVLYSFPDGKKLRQFRHPGNCDLLRFSDEGRYLALASETLHVWDLQSEQAPPQVFSHPAKVLAFDFSARSDKLATTSEDHLIRVYELGKPGKSEPLFRSIPNPTGVPPILVNNGRELVMITGDREVVWWDANSGKRLRVEQCAGGSNVFGLEKNREDNAFVVFDWPVLDVWGLDSAAGWERHSLESHHNVITEVAWSADHSLIGSDALLASSSIDRTVKLWRWRDGQCIGTIPHQNVVSNVACSKDGSVIATVQEHSLVRLWTAPSSSSWKVNRIADDATTHRVLVSRDGQYLVRAGWWGARECSAARIYEMKDLHEVGEPLETGGYLNSGAISPQGDLVVTLGSNEKKGETFAYKLDWAHLPGQVVFWKFPASKQCFSPIKTAGEPIDADFSPDGKWLAVVCAEGTVLLIDPRTGRVERKYQGRDVTSPTPGFRPDRWILFSPHGDRFLTVNFGSEVCIRFMDEQMPEVRIVLAGVVRHAEFSDDGKLVVAAYDDKVRVFDALTGKPQGKLLLHPDWVLNAHFSSDSQVLLTAGRDHMARLWNWRDTNEPLIAMEHSDEVYNADFSANNRWVITVGADARLSVWDRAGGMRVMPFATLSDSGLGQCLFQCLFTPDKKQAIIPCISPFVDVFDLSELTGDENGQADGSWRLPWAEIISGRQVRKNGTVNLSGDEWLKRWQIFDDSYPQVIQRLIERNRFSKEKTSFGNAAKMPLSHPDYASPAERYHAKLIATNAAKSSWSPNGQKIVFGTMPFGAGLKIFDFKADTVVDLLDFGKDPAWSPGDGKWIAFVKGSLAWNNTEVWIVENSGKNPRRIAEGGWPCWSSDGKTLFYHSNEQQKMFAVQPDTKAAVASEICEMPWSYFPIVSPDGTLIGYMDDDALHVINRATKKETITIALPAKGMIFPCWSPEKKQIGLGIESSDQESGGLWSFNLETQQYKQILSGPYTIPVWSPDGSKIAFDRRDGNRNEVWVIETKYLNTAK